MPDDEGLREELAAALLAQTMLAGAQVRAVLDALLPVVERYGRHCAAEALRELPTCPVCTRRKSARADALAADGTELHPAHRQDDGGCSCPDYCARHDGPGQWM